MRGRLGLWIALGLLLAARPLALAGDVPPRYVFACRPGNDLYRAVSAALPEVPRCEAAAEAVRRAPRGAGVLVLASGYPARTTEVEPGLFAEARRKGLRLYVEYPHRLPGLALGAPVAASGVERGVVTSSFFGPALGKGSIAILNGLRYVAARAERSHLVAARVAGFDTAVYGLPETTHPLLFELSSGDVMVATTRLSDFVRGRFAPREAWRSIWSALLGWLDPGAEPPALDWTPVVRSSFGRAEPLPEDHEREAIRRALEWYRGAGMIVAPELAGAVEAAAARGRMPLPPAPRPAGDGSLGSLEAVLSIIGCDGRQPVSVARRGDCTCESAMALAFGAKLLQRREDRAIAANLLDFYLFESEARKRERADPRHGAYGLIAWGISTPAWYAANYGDDNARQVLGTLATAALLGEDRWDEAVMMCLLANLRTAGKLGFREARIDLGPLGRRGWEPYFRSSPTHFSPHYQAYLWAAFLWAYEHTRFPLFLERPRTALRMTMERYTDGWRWTNGLAQEKARILLPLAWLVRVDDTPRHRAWLRRAARGVLALQDECGAIREELGLPGRGDYPPPASNEAYGTTEASLIARNGDRVTDLLYSANFAFLALHEAAAATGDRDIARAEDRLAEFLCRIQVRSERDSSLDGGWFRAFDFGRWEHWGSNADTGWGAWCIESGWTEGWIVSVLALREMGTSLWDLTRASRAGRHFERLRRSMLPDAVLRGTRDTPERSVKSRS